MESCTVSTFGGPAAARHCEPRSTIIIYQKMGISQPDQRQKHAPAFYSMPIPNSKPHRTSQHRQKHHHSPLQTKRPHSTSIYINSSSSSLPSPSPTPSNSPSSCPSPPRPHDLCRPSRRPLRRDCTRISSPRCCSPSPSAVVVAAG